MVDHHEGPRNISRETKGDHLPLPAKFIEQLSQKWSSLSPEQRVYFTQLGLMAVVQAVDVLTTYAALQMVPGAIEGNPTAGFFLDQGGITLLLVAKMGTAAVQIIALELIRNRMVKGKTGSIPNVLRLSNSILTAISVSNAAHLFIK